MQQPHATTILCVHKDGCVALGGDGQVTLGQTVMKGNARKVRRLRDGNVLAGSPAARPTPSPCSSASRRRSTSSRATSPGPPSSWPRTGAPTGRCGASRRC
jgi:hypothetical protein